MFYRRKIIFALLEAFGGSLPLINLYKLLLIATRQQQKAEYDFIPYKFGCYSFSLHADLATMCKQGLLREENNKLLYKLDERKYFPTISENDKKIILAVREQFEQSNTNDLLKYTYTRYPYTASRSTIAEQILSPAELLCVQDTIPKTDETILFTIGYEGISLEEYLNRLIQHDVKLLVDVRRNPLSMKFGFSKSQLKKYCESIGLEYTHIPEVGIASELRRELKEQSDYDRLFVTYRSETLTHTEAYQEKIFNLLEEKKRIALTCFEAAICQCHRSHLAEAITKHSNWRYTLSHI